MKRLKSIIEQKKLVYGNKDDLFRQMVYDHKEYIKQNSTVVALKEQDKEIYKYRDALYLMEKLGINSSELLWIIYYINDMYPMEHFYNKQFLYIPDITIIEGLYENYKIMNARK